MENVVVLQEILNEYSLKGEVTGLIKIEIGHINDTYCLSLSSEGVIKRYILQKINNKVFKDIEGLIANIVYVTSHLRGKLIEASRDPSREAMRILPTFNGRYYYLASDGGSYRIYDYIEGSVCHLYAESAEQFREAALSYAAFQKYLSDIDINTIKDTITDFHNTVKRLEKFRLAVDGDSARRAAKCSELISFVNERAAYSDIIVARLEKGELPYRVTHNDTKINNVLFDEKTDKGLCVIDLDTIMRGSMLYDFGDAIRYGCNTAKEDEKDLDKIVFDKEKYEAYESAYIEVLGNTMTAKERELLRIAPLIMTYELVIRFLTDYLEGDVYFKTHYADHNYYRARCQAKLLSEMEKWRDNKVGIL